MILTILLSWPQLIDIDECTSDPCRNGATCVDLVNEYRCECAAGWTSTICTISEYKNIYCTSLIIAVFVETGKKFIKRPIILSCWDALCIMVLECSYFCSNTTDINECASAPCQNDGTCTDNINGYTCTCRDGYEGSNCETGLWMEITISNFEFDFESILEFIPLEEHRSIISKAW